MCGFYKVTVRVWWLNKMKHLCGGEWPKNGRQFPLFFRNSNFYTIFSFLGCLLTVNLTHEFHVSPNVSCQLALTPWGGVDRLLLRETCPLTIITVEIYTLNNLFLLGLGFIYWMILPLGPVSCSARFYLIREWGGRWGLWSVCLQTGVLSPGATLAGLL